MAKNKAEKKEKKFGTSIFGYKKKRVNEYIYENITNLAKENEELKAENNKIREALEALKLKQDEIENGKSAIATAILKAEETANNILKDATEEAKSKVVSIADEIDTAKEKFVEQKNQIRSFKNDIIEFMNKTATELDKIISG